MWGHASKSSFLAHSEVLLIGYGAAKLWNIEYLKPQVATTDSLNINYLIAEFEIWFELGWLTSHRNQIGNTYLPFEIDITWLSCCV